MKSGNEGSASEEAGPDVPKLLADLQPRFLAVLGKNDPFFLPAGAEAFRPDPDAKIHFFDGTHQER
jgi:hypothetical protein